MAYRTQCTDCLMPKDRNGDCPLRGMPLMPCGWGAEEAERRRNLPLVWDNLSRTRRKIVRERNKNIEEKE